MPTAFPSGFYPKANFSMELGTRLKRVSFGDGYEQVSPDGLNPKTMRTELVFTGLDNSQKDSFVTWYDGLVGEYVTYQIPDDVKARVWAITKFSIRRLSATFWEITIGFELKYTPV